MLFVNNLSGVRRRAAIMLAASGVTLAIVAPPVRAQDAPSVAGSTLELPLNTDDGMSQGVSMPPARRPQAPAKASSTRATPSRSTSTALRGLPALPSRGSFGRESFRQQPTQAPTVLANLGLVTLPEVRIKAGRETNAALMNVVTKGTYLAVVTETGEHYGVLMVNNTVGWVPKPSIQLVDYQTEVSLPADPQTAPPPPAENAASTSAGWASGLGAGLDARSYTLLKEAFTYLGVPYVWAGNTRRGVDCSGFVKNVYSTQGVSLPRHSGDQAKVGQTVQWDDLRPGDRLYFDMGRKGRVSHTGIYIGNGYFIHASSNRKQVDVDSIFKPNYYRALVVAKRDW